MTRDPRVPEPLPADEAAALDCLGLASEEELAGWLGDPRFEAESAVFRTVAAGIATGLAQSPPPRLRERVLKSVAFEASKQIVVRADEGVWKEQSPGVERKMLRFDKATQEATFLLRMKPGAVLPEHHHHAVEQCLVLEGSVRMESETYRSGDYVVLAAGSDHPPVVSVDGCVVLIAYSGVLA